METEILKINGFTLPVVKMLGLNQLFLAMYEGDPYSLYKFASSFKANIKALELEMNGIPAEVKKFGLGFYISILKD